MRLSKLVAWLVLGAAAGPFVYGQTSLSVSPTRIESAVAPGRSAASILIVGNDSPETIRIHAQIETWTMGRTGIDAFPAEGAAGLSGRAWIRVDEPAFSLRAGEEKDIRVTLTAPGDAEPGQYAAALSFEAASESPAGEPFGGIRLQGKLSVLVVITVGRPVPSGTIEDLTVDRKDGRDVLRLRLKNSSRFFLPTEGKLEIRNEKGKKVSTTDILEEPVPPLSERIFSIPLSKKLAPGRYQAECSLRLAAGKTAALKKPLLLN